MALIWHLQFVYHRINCLNCIIVCHRFVRSWGLNNRNSISLWTPNLTHGPLAIQRFFITITSGLVDMMTEEELDAVIAHECGHILCHHVLYHSIAHYVMDGLDSLGVLGSLGVPIQYAILYWERKK